jgi:hypothetical protein
MDANIAYDVRLYKTSVYWVAEWAGHSVAILLKIYAKCLDGQDAIAKRRIKEALGNPGEDDSR